MNIDNCPGELAIYVHGVWTTYEIANEQTERVSLSQKTGFNIPLIGSSWDSNTTFSLDDLSLSEYGWNIANIYNSNGHLLGKFIQQLYDICPDDDIRIISHSL